LKQTEQQEKELREAVEMQLRMLEGNICIGGVNLFDENMYMQEKIQKQEAELKAAEEDRKRLQQKLHSQKEEDFGMEEKYSSLQEEVTGRREKNKRLQSRLDYYQSESTSIRREWEREKMDLLQTVRDLSRDLKRKQAIVDCFIPDQMQQLIIEQLSKWDADVNDWSIRSVRLAGNLSTVVDDDNDDNDQPSVSNNKHKSNSTTITPTTSTASSTTKKPSVFTSKFGMQIYLSYSSSTNSTATTSTTPIKPKVAAPLVTTAALQKPSVIKKPISISTSPSPHLIPRRNGTQSSTPNL
jgi:chromosome segregation ATPase